MGWGEGVIGEGEGVVRCVPTPLWVVGGIYSEICMQKYTLRR